MIFGLANHQVEIVPIVIRCSHGNAFSNGESPIRYRSLKNMKAPLLFFFGENPNQSKPATLTI
jgi:hypothetical protein